MPGVVENKAPCGIYAKGRTSKAEKDMKSSTEYVDITLYRSRILGSGFSHIEGLIREVGFFFFFFFFFLKKNYFGFYLFTLK